MIIIPWTQLFQFSTEEVFLLAKKFCTESEYPRWFVLSSHLRKVWHHSIKDSQSIVTGRVWPFATGEKECYEKDSEFKPNVYCGRVARSWKKHDTSYEVTWKHNTLNYCMLSYFCIKLSLFRECFPPSWQCLPGKIVFFIFQLKHYCTNIHYPFISPLELTGNIRSLMIIMAISNIH